MTVLNNTAAAMTLGELNKNVSQVGKQLAKVSSGQKITGAGDGVSEYSVSERMRVRIRGLEQDIQNTKTGTSMLKTADGGVRNIIEELRSLRELAVNASNDHNTDADRAVLQKEFNQRRADIEDIATSTNYNGTLLLDGTWAIREETEQIEHIINKPGGKSDNPPISSGVIEPNDPPTIIPNGDYAIQAAGTYVMPANYSGTISIADGLVGVKIQQATAAQLTNVFINGPASGNANLWLDGINVKNTQDQSFIRFSGSGNVLSIKGNNTLEGAGTVAYQHLSHAAINIGDGLTIEGTGSLSIHSSEKILYSAAVIGADANVSSSADITINSGVFSINMPAGEGAMIGSGTGGSIGNITINGGTFDLLSTGIGACIGSAGRGGRVQDINITHAIIHARTDDAACIGSGGINSSVGDIRIESSTVNCTVTSSYNSTGYGAGVGSGRMSSAGDITIINTQGSIQTDLGEEVGKGYQGTVGNVYIDPPIEPDPEIYYQNITVRHGKPLVIHTGTKANQALYCYINDMRLDALGLGQDKETGVDKVQRLRWARW